MTAKILIVDDEPTLLRLVGYALHKAGFEIVIAQQGEEALRKVQAEKPDLVILDVMLPGLSGIEICQRLRNQPQTAHLPILMLSARDQVKDKIEGLHAGADEYVTKPIDTDELAARVEALLERTRRLRAMPPEKRGKILGFIGAKGGVGTTTVALNVAMALVQQRQAVIAAELRPYFGAFSLQLGRMLGATLGSLLDLEPEAIGERELALRLANHPSGLRLLLGPQHVAQYRELRPEQAEAVLDGLRRLADYVVVDLPAYPSPANQAAARRCDVVTVVLEPIPSCVKAAQITLDLLKTWGVGGGLVQSVVVNRVSWTTPMSAEEITEQLGSEIVGSIPPAAEACFLAEKTSVPLVAALPESVASVNLRGLAARLAPELAVGMEIQKPQG
jgi:DNA-binding response OmpR family regulator